MKSYQWELGAVYWNTAEGVPWLRLEDCWLTPECVTVASYWAEPCEMVQLTVGVR